nr:hypothetical protein [Tanacetum cinerariifolium]
LDLEGSTQGYPLVSVEVLTYDKRGKRENMGIVPTAMGLILEHTKQDMAPLPPRDQRHLSLCYQDLAEMIRMVYTGEDGQEVFSTCRIGDEMGLDVVGLFERCSLVYSNQRSSSEAVPQVDLMQHF